MRIGRLLLRQSEVIFSVKREAKSSTKSEDGKEFLKDMGRGRECEITTHKYRKVKGLGNVAGWPGNTKLTCGDKPWTSVFSP